VTGGTCPLRGGPWLNPVSAEGRAQKGLGLGGGLGVLELRRRKPLWEAQGDVVGLEDAQASGT